MPGERDLVPISVVMPVIEGAYTALAHLAKTLPTEPAEVRLAGVYAASEAGRLAATMMLLTPTKEPPHAD